MDALLNLVLELYRLAQEVPPAEFPALALQLLNGVVRVRTATRSDATLEYLRRHGRDRRSLIADLRARLYRPGGDEPLSEHETAIVDLLMPHFAEALLINRAFATGERAAGPSGQSKDARARVDRDGTSRFERLSPRELAIAREFGAGKTYKTIARELELAPATVRNVLQKVYRKLGIDNKAELGRLLALEQRVRET